MRRLYPYYLLHFIYDAVLAYPKVSKIMIEKFFINVVILNIIQKNVILRYIYLYEFLYTQWESFDCRLT